MRLGGSNTGANKTTPSGLRYTITTEGTGASPAKGQTVEADYDGWLNGFGVGEPFDSSIARGEKFSFRAGIGEVIPGWDEAILGMKEGETREIELPPHLGYGANGAGGVIPPNATLYFRMTLHNVK